MRGSIQGSSRTGEACRVVVADTGALLTGKILSIPHRSYTTPSVVEEVRDAESRRVVEMALSTGRLEVLEPVREALEEARKAARRAGVLGRLSGTDLEVLALALTLKNESCEVLVATDDDALQRAVIAAGFRVVRLRYPGVKGV